ncbi:nitrogen fixation protein NifW [Roseospira marina]|uniref:Nitrogenase-stabilizing/protective protein NifW n=1 Tax=Roseospira marina TaxID=140057 RepID=A0A5M6IH36_9PROT|nr:nitrogenase-stabilizing/protective protein NifW [Roseospira marina]KAA5607616.1 nitrogen fixation protein NifW [Roseospira marina]MBB4312186.1 nitrogenase-stabilizing/protective protein [Roseospira marina]MBB5085798.1 nitrogenase-stabilizing/protective protein [Roseospira marina]
MSTILAGLTQLSAAEEFFEALDVPYDSSVLASSRLHILKRFGEYAAADPSLADDSEFLRACLARAHTDFIESDARREKVFAVFRQQHADGAGRTFIPLEALTPSPSTARGG